MQIIYLLMGHIMIGLGMLGVFLPVLPTVPFVLAAAYCFSRSSPEFHDWLLNHKYFGEMIKNWQRNRSISVRAKKQAMLVIFLSFGYSIYTVGPTALKIMLAIIAVLVSSFILTRKSC